MCASPASPLNGLSSFGIGPQNQIYITQTGGDLFEDRGALGRALAHGAEML